MFSLKFIVFSLKFIVFSSKFIVFSFKFIVFSSKFIVFSSKLIVFSPEVYYVLLKIFLWLRRTLSDIQNQQVYLCSTQENTLQLSKTCKSIYVLLRRTLYDSPKSASLIVFHSGEQYTTIKNWQVHMCSTTQENSLHLKKPNLT